MVADVARTELCLMTGGIGGFHSTFACPCPPSREHGAKMPLRPTSLTDEAGEMLRSHFCRRVAPEDVTLSLTLRRGEIIFEQQKIKKFVLPSKKIFGEIYSGLFGIVTVHQRIDD